MYFRLGSLWGLLIETTDCTVTHNHAHCRNRYEDRIVQMEEPGDEETVGRKAGEELKVDFTEGEHCICVYVKLDEDHVSSQVVFAMQK